MTTKIVTDYKKLMDNIAKIIEISGYRNQYLADKIGMAATTFSMKKQRKSFSLEEMEKLIVLIDNDDVEQYLILEILRDRKNEENISSSDFKSQMGWK